MNEIECAITNFEELLEADIGQGDLHMCSVEIALTALRWADAAVEDLNSLRKSRGPRCFACKYEAEFVRERCGGCLYNSGHNWEWRGPQGEGEE